MAPVNLWACCFVSQIFKNLNVLQKFPFKLNLFNKLFFNKVFEGIFGFLLSSYPKVTLAEKDEGMLSTLEGFVF